MDGIDWNFWMLVGLMYFAIGCFAWMAYYGGRDDPDTKKKPSKKHPE